jgi:hypothetical protein
VEIGLGYENSLALGPTVNDPIFDIQDDLHRPSYDVDVVVDA